MLNYLYMHKDKFDIDFELPEVITNVPTRPRIHIGNSVCTSCEG